MPQEDKPKELNKETKPEKKEPELLTLRRKSLTQIAKEGVERTRKEDQAKLDEVKDKLKEKSEEKPDAKSDKDKQAEKTEEVKDEKPKKEAKPKVDPEEIAAKARDEAKAETARIADEAARRAFKEESQKILDQNKSLEEKQKLADELVSVFEKEKRLPKDYIEVLQEAQRVAEVKFKQLQFEKDENDKKSAETRKQEEETKRTESEKQQQTQIDDINSKVERDLEDFYTSNVLPRPPKEYDANHPDQKATDDLMRFGIELNTERAKKGLPPVDSITKIYFLHYKPKLDLEGKKDDQPAGADAPISGAAAPTSKAEVKGYNYARDHKKSYRQILEENMRRQKAS